MFFVGVYGVVLRLPRGHEPEIALVFVHRKLALEKTLHRSRRGNGKVRRVYAGDVRELLSGIVLYGVHILPALV